MTREQEAYFRVLREFRGYFIILAGALLFLVVVTLIPGGKEGVTSLNKIAFLVPIVLGIIGLLAVSLYWLYPKAK